MTNSVNARGLYRTTSSESGAKYARVRYIDKHEMDIPEDRYRTQGYQPEFDNLPSKDEYDATIALGRTNAPGAKGERRPAM